jgi:hypothetical protein
VHFHTNPHETKGLENEPESVIGWVSYKKGRELILTIILYLTIAVIYVLPVYAMFCFEGLIIH